MENQNKEGELVVGKLFSVTPLKAVTFDSEGKMHFENRPLAEGLSIEVNEGDSSIIVETLEWEDDEIQLKPVGFRFQKLMQKIIEKYDAVHVRALLDEYLNCVNFAKNAIEDVHGIL